jgi:ABC-type glycerol-3-phosphate transport system permease component
MASRTLTTNKVLTLILLLVLGVLTLMPFYFMLITSFKPMDVYLEEKILPPSQPTLDNYITIFDKFSLGTYFGNNFMILAATIVPYILMCSAAGFAFAQLRFPMQIPLLLLVSGIMIFPQMVLGVPLYALLSKFHLINSRLGLVLCYLGYFTPYAAYLMTTYYRNIPGTFMEAAKIDGANLWQVFTRVMLPMAKTMIVTVIIVGSQAVWNELPFAMLFLRTEEKRTLMTAVALLKGEQGVAAIKLCAALTAVALPIIILYIIAQNQIQQGILAGGIKE